MRRSAAKSNEGPQDRRPDVSVGLICLDIDNRGIVAKPRQDGLGITVVGVDTRPDRLFTFVLGVDDVSAAPVAGAAL